MIAANIQRFLQRHFPRPHSFLQARLAPDGLFGRYFTIGAISLIGAVWMFGGISEDLITGDPLVVIDAFLSEWFRSHRTQNFTEAMQTVSAFASTPAVIALSTIAACFLLWKRLWYRLLALIVVVAGGMFLNVLLKHLLGRERPGWADAALSDSGFPSGHTMMATIIYGFLATYLILGTHSWPARFLIAIMTISLVFLIALSRIYLGAHYLSDVLGAMAAGTAWLALCLTATESARRHQGSLLSIGRR